MSDPYLTTKPTLMRAVLDGFAPPGSLWSPAPNGGFDNFEDGIGDALQALHDALAQIGHIRDPLRTPYLVDLEREYGIDAQPGTTEAQRRANLLYRKTARGLKGQSWVLQNAINAAGFTGVTVVPNDPAVDPQPFLTGTSQIVLGGTNSCLGYYTTLGQYLSFCATYGGVLIVNGAQLQNNPAYTCCLGAGGMFCHTPWAGQVNNNMCGAYTYSTPISSGYGTPKEPWMWPLVFFVGGTATYNGDGSLATLTQAQIPTARVNELISIILRYKPLHTWCAFIYTAV